MLCTLYPTAERITSIRVANSALKLPRHRPQRDICNKPDPGPSGRLALKHLTEQGCSLSSAHGTGDRRGSSIGDVSCQVHANGVFWGVHSAESTATGGNRGRSCKGIIIIVSMEVLWMILEVNCYGGLYLSHKLATQTVSKVFII